ncbi:hypothetical protein [Streptacidiphilus sp. EB129]|uniref:hypothetical protein n=1 Tax=Streptacidiphilus sp. EB129 TaxID=3156262 RepID=UPI003513C8F0
MTGTDLGNTEWDGKCWTVTNIIEEPVTGYHYRCQADAQAVAQPLGLVALRVYCATKCTHPAPPICCHCGDPITGDWMSNIPRPGQESVPIRFRHFDRRACLHELPLLPLLQDVTG